MLKGNLLISGVKTNQDKTESLVHAAGNVYAEGLGVGGSLQHSGGVDDLTAHLGGGLVHGGQTGAV